jgi:peptidyl-prolyl isomerase H (cyclophilin H)
MVDFCMDNPPNSGKNPKVYMSFTTDGEKLGTVKIELFRDVFPLAVENFVYLCKGSTYREDDIGIGTHTIHKITKRTYEDSKAYKYYHNRFIEFGDIYKNDGTSAATIYNDELIPAYYADYFYPHDSKGLISLIPYEDPITGLIYFDSNFKITLSAANPINRLASLDKTDIVIGRIYSGLDVIESINNLITPFAGREYPTIRISECGILSAKNFRPRKFF